MVKIKFPDREAAKKGVGFLAGRFSCRLHRSGVLFVPEESLVALAEENLTFTVLGRVTYAEYVASMRGAAAMTDE